MTTDDPRDALATMDSFIVLVYRRDGEGGAAVLAGLVERTADGMRRPFRTVEELWSALAAPASSSARKPPARPE